MKKDIKKKLTIELVDELTKMAPDLEKVKNLMLTLNIPYSEDPLALLNTVLVAINTYDKPGAENEK
jgi:hypothetical protein